MGGSTLANYSDAIDYQMLEAVANSLSQNLVVYYIEMKMCDIQTLFYLLK